MSEVNREALAGQQKKLEFTFRFFIFWGRFKDIFRARSEAERNPDERSESGSPGGAAIKTKINTSHFFSLKNILAKFRQILRTCRLYIRLNFYPITMLRC